MEHTDLRVEVNTILSETLLFIVGDDVTVENLGGLVEELSLKLIEAAAKNDEEAMDITLSRIKMRAEQWRIKANDMAWSAVQRILSAVFQIAKNAIVKGVTS